MRKVTFSRGVWFTCVGRSSSSPWSVVALADIVEPIDLIVRTGRGIRLPSCAQVIDLALHVNQDGAVVWVGFRYVWMQGPPPRCR